MVRRQSDVLALADELVGAIHIAQRTDGVRAAARDGVGVAPLGAHALGDLLHLGVHVRPAGVLLERGAVQQVANRPRVSMTFHWLMTSETPQSGIAGVVNETLNGTEIVEKRNIHLVALRRKQWNTRVGNVPTLTVFSLVMISITLFSTFIILTHKLRLITYPI